MSKEIIDIIVRFGPYSPEAQKSGQRALNENNLPNIKALHQSGVDIQTMASCHVPLSYSDEVQEYLLSNVLSQKWLDHAINSSFNTGGTEDYTRMLWDRGGRPFYLGSSLMKAVRDWDSKFVCELLEYLSKNYEDYIHNVLVDLELSRMKELLDSGLSIQREDIFNTCKKAIELGRDDLAKTLIQRTSVNFFDLGISRIKPILQSPNIFKVALDQDVTTEQKRKLLDDIVRNELLDSLEVLLESGVSFDHFYFVSDNEVKMLDLMIQHGMGEEELNVVLTNTFLRSMKVAEKALIFAIKQSFNTTFLKTHPLLNHTFLGVLSESTDPRHQKVLLDYLRMGDPRVDILLSDKVVSIEQAKVAHELMRSMDPLLIGVALDNGAMDIIEGKTVVGLSNVDGSWSAEYGDYVFKMMARDQNLWVVPITEKVFLNSGVMSRVSGLINPGSMDTFPSNMTSFGIEDLDTEKMDPMEILYQQVISFAKKHGIPYMGTCGGAQHLVLNSGGKLRPVRSHNIDRIRINFVPGSVPYYTALTPDQKGAFLRECDMPEVSIKQGVVYHNYAGLEGSLGKGIELGARSVQGVVEAFAHGSNHVGYQFHPEYNSFDRGESFKRPNGQILETFFQLCKDRQQAISDAIRKGIPQAQTSRALANIEKAFLLRMEECRLDIRREETVLPDQCRQGNYLWNKVMGNHTVFPEEGIEGDSIMVMPGILPEQVSMTRQGNDLALSITSDRYQDTLRINGHYSEGGQSAIDFITYANGETHSLPDYDAGKESPKKANDCSYLLTTPESPCFHEEGGTNIISDNCVAGSTGIENTLMPKCQFPRKSFSEPSTGDLGFDYEQLAYDFGASVAHTSALTLLHSAMVLSEMPAWKQKVAILTINGVVLYWKAQSIMPTVVSETVDFGLLTIGANEGVRHKAKCLTSYAVSSFMNYTNPLNFVVSLAMGHVGHKVGMQVAKQICQYAIKGLVYSGAIQSREVHGIDQHFERGIWERSQWSACRI